MRSQVIVAVFAVVLLLACAVARGAEGDRAGEGLAYAQMLKGLGSADVSVRKAAQDQVLSLGPEKVDEIRSIAGFLQEVVTMHDKLVAKPSHAVEEADRHRENAEIDRNAQEAIRYFSSRGAVAYLALGLESQLFFVQAETGQALAGLDRRIKERQAKAFVSAVASFLARQRPVPGSETATIQQITVETLCSAISEVAAMSSEGPDREALNAEARAALGKLLEQFPENMPAGAAAKKALESLDKPGPAAPLPQPTDARPEPRRPR